MSFVNRLGSVMVYVNNQDAAKEFWTEKLGFAVINEEDNGGGFRFIEVAPTGQSETSIVLHNKEFVAKMSPELNMGTPSLMFFSDHLDEFYSDLKNKNVTVGELVTMPFGRVFNFCDDESNYFAVMEKK